MKRWDWVAIAFSLVAMAWMVTEGTWEFFGTTGHLESFFDAQAESLLHGRIDVPPETISYEAWVYNGKAHGYFGPTPSLFRIPLVLLFPQMKGHWSRLSMFSACLVTLTALWLLFQLLELGALRPLFILAVCLGSTQYFLLSESKVYQEASAWAASLSLLSLVCLAHYLAAPRTRWIAFSCVAAFLSFNARVASGAGPLFALLLILTALFVPRLREHLGVATVSGRTVAAMLAVTLALSSFSWAGLNKWKFGRWLTSMPIELNLEYTKERQAMVKGELVSLANLPATLYVYLNPAHIDFPGRFPWVSVVVPKREDVARKFPSAHLDLLADVVSFPVAAPELFFGALAGTILVFGGRAKRLGTWRAPLAGAAAGCVLFLLFGFMTVRYLHDAFPWVVIGTAAAISWVLTDGPAAWRKPLVVVFTVLTLWAMWVMLSLAFVQQRWLAVTVTTEQRMATLDLFTASREGGISGLLSHWTHWRTYRAASDANSGNLTKDSRFVKGSGSESVARSSGAPPYGAGYILDVPADGQYELSIRYASSIPRPVVLAINGQPVGYVCTVATGGDGPDSLKWTFGGRHALRKGPVRIDLQSNAEFPVLQALRLVRAD